MHKECKTMKFNKVVSLYTSTVYIYELSYKTKLDII